MGDHEIRRSLGPLWPVFQEIPVRLKVKPESKNGFAAYSLR
jgi:hypothetical protein